jgi:hypothetical protein
MIKYNFLNKAKLKGMHAKGRTGSIVGTKALE